MFYVNDIRIPQLCWPESIGVGTRTLHAQFDATSAAIYNSTLPGHGVISSISIDSTLDHSNALFNVQWPKEFVEGLQ